MPPKPLPIDRKKLLDDKEPSSSNPNSHGSPLSCRGPFDICQPFSVCQKVWKRGHSVPLQSTPDDSTSRNKARLGWGEGLAKYENKKVVPDDFVDKEAGVRDGPVVDVSCSEQLPPNPSNLPGKSPTLFGFSDSASPTNSRSFACSSSPVVAGLEEKTSITPGVMDNDVCNPSAASCHLPQNHTFNLENLENTEGFNLSCSLDGLLQTYDTSAQGSGFATDKLHVRKADVLRTLEITETEIDSLENELKSLVSEHNNKNTKEISMEKAECSQDHGTKYKSYYSILALNKAVANETHGELSKILLPTTQSRTNHLKATRRSRIKRRFARWKRSFKVKERLITLKFQTLQYSWKNNINLLSVNKSIDAHKKSDPSFYVGRTLKLAPTKEMVDYVNKLLSDSRVKNYRKALKMPSLILDKRERLASMFRSKNGLVENPIDVEKEKSIINPWTAEDKELFLEKYSLFRKNFRKIATFFKHKTVADCVEFYYKNHKSDNFQKTKKIAKGKSYTNPYLVTSEKQRLNRAKKSNHLNDFLIYCNVQEAAAADVLAGICGSISSEGLGSCITSSVEEDLRSSDSKLALLELEIKPGEKGINVNLEGDSDSEVTEANPDGSPSRSLSVEHGTNLDLNTPSENITSQEPEPEPDNGFVKLFGQILTKNSSNKPLSLKFDQNNLQSSRHRFWDLNRIQTGFPSLPDSAGFQDPCNLKSGKNVKVLSGFPTKTLQPCVW